MMGLLRLWVALASIVIGWAAVAYAVFVGLAWIVERAA